MSGISFTGIGSGMPVKDLVDAFVNAEKVPFQQRLNKQGAKLTTNISANGALKSSLSSLATSLEKLKDVENFQLRKASGGDEFIKVSSDKTAQVGSYDIKVNNLAQAHKTMSNTSFVSDAAVGEGTLSFATIEDVRAGNSGFSIEVNDTDTLSDVRDKINSAATNSDVTATIITEDNGQQRLVMASNSTGLDNEVVVTATDGAGLDATNGLANLRSAAVADLSKIEADDPLDPRDPLNNNLQQIKPALDASITIDGVITLTSATNEFENAIDGITLTAQKAHDVDDDISTASVSEDNSMVARELGAFVKAYNEYYDLAKTLGKADGEGASGAMVGDSMLRGVTSKLRNMLSGSFDSNNGNTLSLSQLGVEADQYGKLTLDSDRLKETLDADPTAVQQFFIGTDDKPGFAASMEGLLDNYTKSGGLIESRIDGYKNQLDKLDDDMEVFGRKMEKYEKRLLAQYNAMDLLVANMTATSNSLMGQLNNMPGVVRKTR